MTLETAKRQVLAQGEMASKEALAIVWGGMTICDRAADGRRIYPCIKVEPTETDEESSIDVALENYQKRKRKLLGKNVEESVPQETPAPNSPSPQAEPEAPASPNFFERLKKKAIEIWKEIDSIVVE